MKWKRFKSDQSLTAITQPTQGSSGLLSWAGRLQDPFKPISKEERGPHCGKTSSNLVTPAIEKQKEKTHLAIEANCHYLVTIMSYVTN